MTNLIADINAKDNNGNTSLMIAKEKEFEDIVEVIQKIVQVNQDLMNAAKNNNCTKVAEAIANGATIYYQDKDGKTPLQIASANNSLEVVSQLLEYQDKILKNKQEKTPLDLEKEKASDCDENSDDKEKLTKIIDILDDTLNCNRALSR